MTNDTTAGMVTPLRPATFQEGPDGFFIRECARWQHAYARAQVYWAECQLSDVSLGGDEEKLIGGMGGAIDGMEVHQRLLARPDFIPQTTEGARQMLQVAIEILKAREEVPDCTVGLGPAMEILRNVRRGLESAAPDTRLKAPWLIEAEERAAVNAAP